MVLLFWVLVCGGATCFGQEYEVAGTITYDTFIMGQKQFGSKKEFRVSVKECDWLIYAKDMDNGDSVEIGFENGFAYRLNTFVKPDINVLSALIESEEIPNGDSSMISYLWLAFASSCHFAQITNNFLSPVWIMDDPNLRYEDFKMKAVWETNKNLPRLPIRVTYFNDGVFRVYNVVKKERSSFSAPKPYDQGYVNAIYEVLAKTNVSELAIPTSFVFTRYAVPRAQTSFAANQSAQGDKTNLMVRSVIRVDNAKARLGTTVTSFRPKFSATLTYMDRRFARSNLAVINVLNVITNGNWPEVTPALLQRAKITARATSPVRLEDRSGRRKLVLFAFALVTLGFPLFFFFLNRTKK